MLCRLKNPRFIDYLRNLGLLALTCLACGCGTEKREVIELDSPIAASPVTPAIKKPVVSTATVSKTDVAASPAEDSTTVPIDADPTVVCQRFMELLQSGNRIAAENLLTRTALNATSKAGLKLEPMGSPTARYEMGATRYATIKNELALVECEVIDLADGKDVRSPITWLVRKQNLGWRISGLLLQLDPDQPANLLSFENIADVEEIKRRAEGDMLAEIEAESRQAKAGLNPSTLK